MLEVSCRNQLCPKCFVLFRASVPLLIFSLDDLSIDVSGVISILLYSVNFSLLSVSICFIYLSAPYIGYMYVNKHDIS